MRGSRSARAAASRRPAPWSRPAARRAPAGSRGNAPRRPGCRRARRASAAMRPAERREPTTRSIIWKYSRRTSGASPVGAGPAQRAHAALAATSSSMRAHEVLQDEVLLGRRLAVVDFLRPLLERHLDAEGLVDGEDDVEEVEAVDAEIIDRVALRRDLLARDVAGLGDDVGDAVERGRHRATLFFKGRWRQTWPQAASDRATAQVEIPEWSDPLSGLAARVQCRPTHGANPIPHPNTPHWFYAEISSMITGRIGRAGVSDQRGRPRRSGRSGRLCPWVRLCTAGRAGHLIALHVSLVFRLLLLAAAIGALGLRRRWTCDLVYFMQALTAAGATALAVAHAVTGGLPASCVAGRAARRRRRAAINSLSLVFLAVVTGLVLVHLCAIGYGRRRRFLACDFALPSVAGRHERGAGRRRRLSLLIRWRGPCRWRPGAWCQLARGTRDLLHPTW